MRRIINIFVGIVCTIYVVAQKPLALDSVIQYLTDTTLEADFSVSIRENISQPNIYTGRLRMRGEYFDIDLHELRIAYDGSTLYWLDKTTRELTLSHPTQTELRDANPLMYMKYLTDNSKESIIFNNATTTITLLPDDTSQTIIKYTLQVDNNTFLPTAIEVREPRGKSTSLTFRNTRYVPDTMLFSIIVPQGSEIYVNDLR